MLVDLVACHCATGLTRSKSDGYTCRTVRKRLVDAGSNPASSTNTKTPTRLSWGFFFGARACCPVFLRVHAETCGPCPPHLQAGSASVKRLPCRSSGACAWSGLPPVFAPFCLAGWVRAKCLIFDPWVRQEGLAVAGADYWVHQISPYENSYGNRQIT